MNSRRWVRSPERFVLAENNVSELLCRETCRSFTSLLVSPFLTAASPAACRTSITAQLSSPTANRKEAPTYPSTPRHGDRGRARDIRHEHWQRFNAHIVLILCTRCLFMCVPDTVRPTQHKRKQSESSTDVPEWKGSRDL